jgi:Na+-driven multidrug efflux pump
MSYVLLWSVNLVTLLFCRPLVGMYHLSGEASAIAVQLLLMHAAVGAVLWPVGFILPHVFRSAGDVRLTAIISPLSIWVFRVALGYVLALETVSVFGLFSFAGVGMGVMGVWVAMTVDWVARTALFLWRFLSEKWLAKYDAKNRETPQTE